MAERGRGKGGGGGGGEKKGGATFAKETKTIMYGFGDDEHPDDASVALMEQMCMEYIQWVTTEAAQVGSKKGTIQPEDVVFVIRKDKKKYARSLELLVKHEEIKTARKQFGEGGM